MSEREEAMKLALQRIKGTQVYVEPLERTVGDKTYYDFLICGIDGDPILRAGVYAYTSEEEALFGGKLLVYRIQQQGVLERLAA